MNAGVPTSPLRTRSVGRGWPILGLEFLPFVFRSLLRGRRAAILGTGMVVVGIVWGWAALLSARRIPWIPVVAMVELGGWMLLLDTWLRDPDG